MASLRGGGNNRVFGLASTLVGLAVLNALVSCSYHLRRSHKDGTSAHATRTSAHKRGAAAASKDSGGKEPDEKEAAAAAG